MGNSPLESICWDHGPLTTDVVLIGVNHIFSTWWLGSVEEVILSLILRQATVNHFVGKTLMKTQWTIPVIHARMPNVTNVKTILLLTVHHVLVISFMRFLRMDKIVFACLPTFKQILLVNFVSLSMRGALTAAIMMVIMELLPITLHSLYALNAMWPLITFSMELYVKNVILISVLTVKIWLPVAFATKVMTIQMLRPVLIVLLLGASTALLQIRTTVQTVMKPWATTRILQHGSVVLFVQTEYMSALSKDVTTTTR